MNLFFWRKKKTANPLRAGTMALIQEKPLRFTLTVSGVISPPHVAVAQKKIMEICRPGTQSRGILRAEGFQGFARGFDGGTAEIERMFAIDEVVERIAVVAEENMQEKLSVFMGGWTRKARLKFFVSEEMDKARAWLES